MKRRPSCRKGAPINRIGMSFSRAETTVAIDANRIKKGVLAKQVVDRIARDAELRKYHQSHMSIMTVASKFDNGPSVELGIANLSGRCAGGAADKAMTVRGMKLHEDVPSYSMRHSPTACACSGRKHLISNAVRGTDVLPAS